MQTCKFVFDQYSKIIEMDIPKRALLADMKLTFGRFLGVNLFAKKLVYYFKDKAIDSSKPLIEALENERVQPQIQITVKTEELGA